jgi:DNA polymerase I
LREGGRVVTVPAPFKPYFFARECHSRVVEYYAKRKGIPIHVEATELRALDGEPVVRVEVEQPYQVATLRDALPVESFEADVPYVRRVMIDEGWRTSTSYTKLYYDIEVVSGEVACIAVSGVSGRVEVLKGSEKSVLEEFAELAGQADMLLGYNSSNFDYPVLKKRFRYHGLKLPDMPRWYDLLPALQWMRQRMLSSWGLDYVGKNLVGIERVHTDKPFSQLTLQEVCERCQRDVEIIVELDRKYSLSEVDIAKAHISYVFPDEVSLITRCIDSLLLKKARELGLVLPNKPVKTTVQKHSGAFVAQPPEPFKIYQGVLFLDCISLYPSIIVNFRISPDPEGRLYPEMLEELLDLRLRYKQLYRETRDRKYDFLQYACKITANAAYGAFNSVGFRIQRADLGDAVATRGREIVTSLMRFYAGLGYDVIYADTDSCVLAGIPPDQELFTMLAEAGSRHIREVFGADIQVEAKKYYSKLYFVRRVGEESAAKKKYAGFLVYSDGSWLPEPVLDVVGIEVVRSDFPSAAQRLQRQLIEGYLSGKPLAELQGILHSYRQALDAGLFSPEDLAWSKSITKKEYKVAAPHARAAAKLRGSGIPLNVGDKVRFVYTRWGPLPLEQLKGADVPVDKKYYWEKLFERIAERTLGITGRVGLDRWVGP